MDIKLIEMLPKVEIHIHAEAVTSFSTYNKLNKKYNINKKFTDEKSFEPLLQINSLEEMIKNYFFLQTFFRSPEDFSLLAQDVVAYAVRNNIKYMEVYLSPSMVMRQGFVDFDNFLKPIVEAFAAAFVADGPDIRIIIDVSRTFGLENAVNNFTFLTKYLAAHPTDRIIGIGLGGQEMDHPCKVFESVYKAAKEMGLHRVVHAGEEVGPESIWEALRFLGAERIGHGTSAMYDQELLRYLKDKAVPLEICPTSNIATKMFVSEYSEHPIYEYYKKGLLVTLNTDDPILFSIELNQEYQRLLSYNGMTIFDGIRILKNTVNASFAPQATKDAVLSGIEVVETKLIGGAAAV